MRSAFSGICPVTLVLSGGVTARLGSVTVLVQQLLQKLTPPLDDTQNEIVALGVSRRQMPSIHKAVDIAFGSAPSFEQRLFGCAFKDVFSDELPPLHLTPTNRVIRKFWCIDQCIEIVRYGGSAQGGFSEQ